MLKLRFIREEMKLSQKELAERLGVSPSNIYNYETGRTEPSIDLLCQLSRLLGVTVDYLIGNTDELGNVAPGEDLSEEEKKLVLCYRGIGKPERLALMTTAQSFYNQAKDSKNKVII